MRDEVLPPATPPGMSVTVFSRTGAVLEVVGDKVGVPLGRPPVLVPFVVGVVAVGVLMWLARGWYDVGRFLAHSIPQFYARYPIDVQRRLWAQAGIDDVRVHSMSNGAGVVISGVRGAGGTSAA